MNKKEEFEQAFKQRLDQHSQTFVCPFCGRGECKNIWHILRLSTVSRWQLRPKHFVILYSFFFAVLLALLVMYRILMYWLGR
jgi:hypothetical protein